MVGVSHDNKKATMIDYQMYRYRIHTVKDKTSKKFENKRNIKT